MKEIASRLRRSVAVAASIGLAGCSRGNVAVQPDGESTSTSTSTSTPTPTPTSTSTPTPTPTSTSTPTPTPTPPLDAGPAACRILLGPKELAVRSPAALASRGETLEAILDEDGKPRIIALPAGPIPASAPAPAPEALDGGAAAGLSIACAVAADRIYCPDPAGNVHRYSRTGGEDRLVASARTGSRIAAAVLPPSHAVVAYVASRRTSEGWTSEAWIAVDEDPPVRISEDGNGATSVTLAPRAASLLAITVDARAALTAMHARPITYDKGVHLGEDVVLFVGGPGDRRTGAAVALGPSGPGYGLLPIAKDVSDFGLALVRLDDPPRVDEPVSWSMYPNGLDPAPVAAVTGARTWVARVRPRVADPSSDKLLEIGEVSREGTFEARHVVAGTSGVPRDVALALDGHGALWLSWLDTTGSRIERLSCK
jgi:hypothetical protein